METRRLQSIKSYSDIKLEKARLRYEILALKNQLDDNVRYFRSIGNYTTIFTSLGSSFSYGSKIFQGATDLFSRLAFWKKKKKKSNGYHRFDDDLY
jgi:hypothetical protein